MANCNLIIDSCCDLPPEIVDQEGVYLLKFPYMINNQMFYDDLFTTVGAHDFYEGMRNGDIPTTAQMPMTALTEAYEWALEQGKPTVYLSFTSGLSGSYDAAVLLRDQFIQEHPDFELYVVDTLLASIAEGFLVFEALRQRERGLTAEEMKEWAEEARHYVNEEFMVEDLQSLKRGGRISGTVAFAGSKLDVKPMLTIDCDGKLSLNGIARGRKKAVKQLAEYFKKRSSDIGPRKTVLIGHADCAKDAERLQELVEESDSSILVLMCNVGPTIGSHVGPGMLCISFWGANKCENLSMSDRIANKIRGGK